MYEVFKIEFTIKAILMRYFPWFSGCVPIKTSILHSSPKAFCMVSHETPYLYRICVCFPIKTSIDQGFPMVFPWFFLGLPGGIGSPPVTAHVDGVRASCTCAQEQTETEASSIMRHLKSQELGTMESYVVANHNYNR